MDELIFDSYLEEDTTPTEDAVPAETESEQADAQTDTAQPDGAESDKPAQEENPERDTTPKDPETVAFKHRRTTVALDKKAVDSIASALGMGANDVTALLQKGTDYDYKVKQYADLESRLEAYGKELNLGARGVFGLLENARDRSLLDGIRTQIKGEHPEWTEDAVNELAAVRLNEQKREIETRQTQQEQESREAENKPLVDFFLRHPEITVDAMPEEMKADLMNGISPEEALLRHQSKQKDEELESLKNEIEKLKKDAENKRTSIGSAVSEVGGEVEDPFIDAFNREFN